MSERKKKSMPAGDMRPSQLVSGFGPGSIISMENDAVMILGCQVWPKKDEEEKKYEILNHPLLNKILNIEEIRMPFSRDKSRVIPAISFPQWSVCMNRECQILQKHNRVPDPRRNKPGYSCYYCDKNGKFGKLIHARLVVICEKGHIDEFPWVEWTHRDLPDTKCPKSDTSKGQLAKLTGKGVDNPEYANLRIPSPIRESLAEQSCEIRRLFRVKISDLLNPQSMPRINAALIQ